MDTQDNLSTPGERLNRFIRTQFRRKIDFADAMGLSNTQISAYITTRRVFRQKKYIDRLKQLGLNFDWYLHGVGNMLSAEISNSEPAKNELEFVPEKTEKVSNLE